MVGAKRRPPESRQTSRSLKNELAVTDDAVYQKLRNVETVVSEAMVRDSFAVAQSVLHELQACDPSWVTGKRVKILDCNYLQATERRIAKLRASWDSPLPGRALVVWDQQSRLVENVFLALHRLASERSLLGEVLTTVVPDDVWIADRNCAVQVAKLYARRWTIEVVFLEMQTAQCCEVNTLGYPRAALFAFCVALLLQNTFSMLHGSLRSVHGQK